MKLKFLQPVDPTLHARFLKAHSFIHYAVLSIWRTCLSSGHFKSFILLDAFKSTNTPWPQIYVIVDLSVVHLALKKWYDIQLKLEKKLKSQWLWFELIYLP